MYAFFGWPHSSRWPERRINVNFVQNANDIIGFRIFCERLKRLSNFFFLFEYFGKGAKRDITLLQCDTTMNNAFLLYADIQLHNLEYNRTILVFSILEFIYSRSVGGL